jgi:lipopolysaccharide/colanic/teichoic acid biosynthesis glycosyltransferase
MKRTTPLTLRVLAADLLWICVAMLAAITARFGFGWGDETASSVARSFGPELISALLMWMMLSSWKDLDGFASGWWLPTVISQVSVAVATLMAVLLAGEYLARNYISRLVLLYFAALLIVGFTGIRYAIYVAIVTKRRMGGVRRVVIVGADKVAAELAAKINLHPELGLEVTGYLYPEGDLRCDEIRDHRQSTTVPALGIMELLAEKKVDELVLLNPQSSQRELLNLVAMCRNAGMQVSVVPPLYDLYLSQAAIVDVGGVPLLRFQQPEAPLATLAAKRVVDITLGILLGILALPIVTISALILRLRKGQAFRPEMRCGQYGRPFRMFRLNVDRLPVNAGPGERFLDGLSISELPNLLNVLKGDMSLVGPRPESLERANQYSEWTKQRLNAKPGITGLAQVHGLRDEHSSERKARFDLQYCLRPSLFLDLTLIVQTVWTLLARSVWTQASKTQPAMPAGKTEILIGVNRSQSGAD